MKDIEDIESPFPRTTAESRSEVHPDSHWETMLIDYINRTLSEDLTTAGNGFFLSGSSHKPIHATIDFQTGGRFTTTLWVYTHMLETGVPGGIMAKIDQTTGLCFSLRSGVTLGRTYSGQDANIVPITDARDLTPISNLLCDAKSNLCPRGEVPEDLMVSSTLLESFLEKTWGYDTPKSQEVASFIRYALPMQYQKMFFIWLYQRFYQRPPECKPLTDEEIRDINYFVEPMLTYYRYAAPFSFSSRLPNRYAYKLNRAKGLLMERLRVLARNESDNAARSYPPILHSKNGSTHTSTPQ